MGSLISLRNKTEIGLERDTSSPTLKLDRNKELVLCRGTVDKQVKVIKKAKAYVEVIITGHCKYKVIDARENTK
jgi:hypothetical protein